ncbi:unnamed protein product [Brassica rapa subsp. trilocularis]
MFPRMTIVRTNITAKSSRSDSRVFEITTCSMDFKLRYRFEENEEAAFSADSIMFEYLDGGWRERGKGEVKVNVSSNGDKARLVTRAKGNYRLILNASLYPEMKLASMDKKGITFACVNSEGRDGLSTFALKFKDPTIV